MGLRVDAGRGVEGTSLGCDVVAGGDAGVGEGAWAGAAAGAGAGARAELDEVDS